MKIELNIDFMQLTGLINGLWIGTIVACVSWVALGIFVWTQHTSDVYDEDEDYHYKSDILSSLRSHQDERITILKIITVMSLSTVNDNITCC